LASTAEADLSRTLTSQTSVVQRLQSMLDEEAIRYSNLEQKTHTNTQEITLLQHQLHLERQRVEGLVVSLKEKDLVIKVLQQSAEKNRKERGQKTGNERRLGGVNEKMKVQLPDGRTQKKKTQNQSEQKNDNENENENENEDEIRVRKEKVNQMEMSIINLRMSLNQMRDQVLFLFSFSF
jgi:hypothetical protein